MTVNSSRSMTADLDQGSVDGKYKSHTPSREPIARDKALEILEHSQLSDRFYDIEEPPVKIRPDGKIFH